jgi:hypothetical protein
VLPLDELPSRNERQSQRLLTPLGAVPNPGDFYMCRRDAIDRDVRQWSEY